MNNLKCTKKDNIVKGRITYINIYNKEVINAITKKINILETHLKKGYILSYDVSYDTILHIITITYERHNHV